MIEFTKAPPSTPDLYWYRAHLEQIVDGDSLVVRVDLGWNHWVEDKRIRLWGINAWGTSGEERSRGLRARAFIAELCEAATRLHGKTVVCELLLRSVQDANAARGRWLAEVFVEQRYFVDRGNNVHPNHPQSNFVRWININKALVEEGHAQIEECE